MTTDTIEALTKRLNLETGAPLEDCREAAMAADGNYDAAMAILKKKGFETK